MKTAGPQGCPANRLPAPRLGTGGGSSLSAMVDYLQGVQSGSLRKFRQQIADGMPKKLVGSIAGPG